MPVLPLYLEWEEGVGEDSWREVRIPGGFECWRFEMDAGQGVRVEVVFSLGFYASADYRRQVRRWRRRPTRHRPAVSMDEPSVGVILRREVGVVEVVERLGAEAFAAEREGRALRFGGSRLMFGEDGSARMELRHRVLSGDVRFEVAEGDGTGEARVLQAGERIAARRRYAAVGRLSGPSGPIEWSGEAFYWHEVGGERREGT
jgi:hypothetical protein